MEFISGTSRCNHRSFEPGFPTLAGSRDEHHEGHHSRQPIDQSNAKMRFALIIFTAPLASRLYEQRFGTRSRTRQVRCRIWRGLIGEKQILIRIWSNFFVPSLPDTSLCEAQGDGGGPAISCRLSAERQIGREDRRKIDKMFVEPPVATLLAKLR